MFKGNLNVSETTVLIYKPLKKEAEFKLFG